MTDTPKIVMVPIGDLMPNPDNPRVNSSAVPQVAESIRLFGFRVPILINADKMILAGHTRYRAALSLGLEEVPCMDASDLSPDEQAAFSIAENRTSDFSFFDLPKLSSQMADLPAELLASFDLDALVGPGTAGEDEATADKSTETPEKRDGLDLAPFERYQYVTIICRTEFDAINLYEMLGLEDTQKAYIAGNLQRGTSTGRVIEYHDFTDRVERKQQ